MPRNEKLSGLLPHMSPLESKVYSLFSELYPTEMYSLGLDEFAERVMILSRENIEDALKRIALLKRECKPRDLLVKKFLDSMETSLQLIEPAAGVAQVTQVISSVLIKEGFNAKRIRKLVELLNRSMEAWLEFLGKREFSIPVKILVQYQLLGALEILNIIERESKDPDLREEIYSLRQKINNFKLNYVVPGFTDGEFPEVVKILREQGADLGREKIYPRALKYAFDYSESWRILERKALKWIEEDLPRLKQVTKRLSTRLKCNDDPESVINQLKARSGLRGKQALETTRRIRPLIQSLVSKSILRINPKYDARVIETPAYLTPIIPTAAAQGFDGLTKKPYQVYYLTTDPKRAPPAQLADLINTLVHEEYGHCVHFSNTAMRFAADPTITEILPSLHSGTTSEGLAFQRELEFLDLLHKIAKKEALEYTKAERSFLKFIEGYERFDEFLEEIEFATYKFRIIRFLRVVGDTRINSGKQNLLEFLKWAEEKTGLAQRTVFYQLFPAHEGIFPGYATCYAIVGQDIRGVQELLGGSAYKLAKFNAYATSMGYPARSIYIERLKRYARKLARN